MPLNQLNHWHLYAYCGNNPIKYKDSSGHRFTHIQKTIRYKSMIHDLGFMVWRVSTYLSINYSNIKGTKTISLIKQTIKGNSNMIKNGSGVIHHTYEMVYFDKRINKKNNCGLGKITVNLNCLFVPPQEALWQVCKRINLKITM